MRHVEDTLAEIRRRFERGAEEFANVKVAITRLSQQLNWMMIEYLYHGLGRLSWLSRDRELWTQFFFDIPIARHWQRQQLDPLLNDERTETNLLEGIAKFQQLAADAMHVAHSLPGCPIDRNDEYGWAELLFTTAWTHPSGSILRADKHFPLSVIASSLALSSGLKLSSGNRKEFEQQAKSMLSDEDFISFLSPFEASVAMIDLLTGGYFLRAKNGETVDQEDCTASHPQANRESPRAFTDGELAFYPDRVELCGVDICSGPRSQTRRRILDLLRNKQKDGTFVAYSGDAVARELKLTGGQVAVAGAIRDLRDVIVEALRKEANLTCGRKDIILGGGRGYRLAESVSVHFAAEKGTVDITVTKSGGNDGNDGNGGNDRSDRDGNREGRRTWILQQLSQRVRLNAPMVEEHFACSLTTAQRDLKALKVEGKIEFVGSKRTGHYRLANPPLPDP